MDVHFLGTTGYHPNDQRHTMCVMIPELGIVFDAGTGFFRVRERLQTAELHVLLSHAHLDHVIGLSYLFDIVRNQQPATHVYATADKIQVIESHLFHPTLFPVRPPFTAHALEPGSSCRPTADSGDVGSVAASPPPPLNPLESGGEFPLAGGAVVQWFPLAHPGGAIGFRLALADGRSLAYVTDTTATPAADYLPAICGVDLLIHECYFADGSEELAQLTGHSCLSPVLQLAEMAGVGQLALVHLNPLPQTAPTAQQVAALAGSLRVSIPTDGSTLRL